jgi:transcriptional regulator with XRE-family HTH domain
MLTIAVMTPQQVLTHIEKQGIHRRQFAERLGITEQAISFWLSQGWISYDRQCHIEKELGGKLKANWSDVPNDKRPGATSAARANGSRAT